VPYSNYQKKEFQLLQQRELYIAEVASLFPAVGALSLPDKKTALPSAYHFDIAGALEHLKWAQAELQLRVGMGWGMS
jgi:hypothetical protein